MPAQWTGDVVGKMHVHGISNKQVAEKLGCTATYVSMVLNSKKEPKSAAVRFSLAVDELIAAKHNQ